MPAASYPIWGLSRTLTRPETPTKQGALSDQFFRVGVTGRDGEQRMLAQLPCSGLKRWRPRHKALVVAAVRHGVLTFDEACKRYGRYAEEYLSWHDSFSAAGWPEELSEC